MDFDFSIYVVLALEIILSASLSLLVGPLAIKLANGNLRVEHTGHLSKVWIMQWRLNIKYSLSSWGRRIHSRDRERQGSRDRASRDGFTACPGSECPPQPVNAF